MQVMVRSMPLASENEDESQVIYKREIETKGKKKRKKQKNKTRTLPIDNHTN